MNEQYKIRLISRTRIPSGGFSYVDPRTGMVFSGMVVLNDVAGEVQRHRLANPRMYPPEESGGRLVNLDSIADEIDDYTSKRLGYSDQWCIGTPNSTMFKGNVRFCPKCDIELEPQYCPTCAGKRLLNYKCPKCGKEFPK